MEPIWAVSFTPFHAVCGKLHIHINHWWAVIGRKFRLTEIFPTLSVSGGTNLWRKRSGLRATIKSRCESYFQQDIFYLTALLIGKYWASLLAVLPAWPLSFQYHFYCATSSSITMMRVTLSNGQDWLLSMNQTSVDSIPYDCLNFPLYILNVGWLTR